MSLYLKQIEQLVALQKVDDEIFVIRQELANAPKEVEELRKNFANMQKNRELLLDKLNHLKEQEKRICGDIEDEAGRLKKSKNKLMQVGNSKEYQAMMREMDSLERSSRGHEEEKMLLIEELARQTGSFEEFEASFNKMNEELAACEATIDERLDKARAALALLDQRRRETGKVVPMPVLSRYEFIRERLSHPVIVPVHAGICSGCNIAIPPQGFIELQKGTQILSCPNCQRLIYWAEHFSAPGSEAAE